MLHAANSFLVKIRYKNMFMLIPTSLHSRDVLPHARFVVKYFQIDMLLDFTLKQLIKLHWKLQTIILIPQMNISLGKGTWRNSFTVNTSDGGSNDARAGELSIMSATAVDSTPSSSRTVKDG